MNKVITFKCYNNIEEKQFTAINQSLIFIPEVIKGTPVNPYSINLVQKVTALNNDVDIKIEIYPNPVKKVLHVIAMFSESNSLIYLIQWGVN